MLELYLRIVDKKSVNFLNVLDRFMTESYPKIVTFHQFLETIKIMLCKFEKVEAKFLKN